MYAMSGSHILPYLGRNPRLAKGVFIASGSQIIGDVEAREDTSFWFNTVVRGDVHEIRIGARTNVQDNTVIHVTSGTGPVAIGNDVTIGHSAVIHACTLADMCLIGMGAIILDGAYIAERSLVAAGALVPPGRKYPPGSLIKGSPAVVARPLTEKELAELAESAKHYVEYAHNYFPTSVR